MTKPEKIKRVQDATGVDAATAQGYLEAEEWIVSDAVESVRADRRPAAPQPAEVKKLDDGRLAVRWQGEIEAGRSCRWIARDLGISKNTVTEIVRRHRETA